MTLLFSLFFKWFFFLHSNAFAELYEYGHSLHPNPSTLMTLSWTVLNFAQTWSVKIRICIFSCQNILIKIKWSRSIILLTKFCNLNTSEFLTKKLWAFEICKDKFFYFYLFKSKQIFIKICIGESTYRLYWLTGHILQRHSANLHWEHNDTEWSRSLALLSITMSNSYSLLLFHMRTDLLDTSTQIERFVEIHYMAL